MNKTVIHRKSLSLSDISHKESLLTHIYYIMGTLNQGGFSKDGIFYINIKKWSNREIDGAVNFLRNQRITVICSKVYKNLGILNNQFFY
jgi:hypothetical protein